MEIAEVRKRVKSTIDRARRGAVDRRARVDLAGHAFETFMNQVAIPMFRQVENILRVEGCAFKLFTPGGSVRLMSDRAAEDYVEILFDGAAEPPAVVGHTKRSRGGRVIEAEHVLGDPAVLGEEDVLTFLLKELEPLVDR